MGETKVYGSGGVQETLLLAHAVVPSLLAFSSGSGPSSPDLAWAGVATILTRLGRSQAWVAADADCPGARAKLSRR